MSESTQTDYTIAENLRWFAAVYVAALLLVGFAVGMLRAAAGVELPSTGIGIGIYVALVFLAGNRFAGRRGYNWTSRDRHNLALGYLIIAVVTSCLLMAAMFVLEPASLAMVSGLGSMAGILIAIIVGVALLYYGAARLMLKLIARRGGQQ